MRRRQLEDNALSGSLPATLGALASLFTLDVTANRLSGALPASYDGLLSMKYMCVTWHVTWHAVTWHDGC
jgi:hypothetical protein